jgi:Tfp pilus assembly protein PilF
LLGEGKPAEARAEYEAALEDLTEDSRVQVLLPIARTYYLEDNMEQTEATIRQALELEPDNVDALKLISNLLITEGRADEAEEFIARLPEGEHLPADAYLNPGIDLYNQGDLEGALAKFESAAASYPDNALVYYYRGLVLVAQGKNELAAADFRKLLELEPEGDKAAEAKEFLKYLK